MFNIFYIEFIVILIFWFMSKFIFKSKKIDIMFSIIIISSLVLISGYRSISTGADTAGYVRWFKLISAENWKDLKDFTSLEYGYVVLNKIISVFTTDEHVFLIIMSFITILPMCIFIEMKSKNKYLSYLIFLSFCYWTTAMITLRQYTAISMCLLGLLFVEKKGFGSLFGFCFCVFIAYMFHKTALFFIPVYFFKYIRLDIKFVIIAFAFFAVFLVLGEQIVSLLNSFARIQYDVERSGGFNFLVMLICITLFIYIMGKPYLTSDNSLRLYFVMLVYAVILQSLALTMEMLVRATRYPLIGILVLIPNIFEKIFLVEDNKKYQYVFNMIFVVLLFGFMYISIDTSSFPSGYSFY